MPSNLAADIQLIPKLWNNETRSSLRNSTGALELVCAGSLRAGIA